MAVVLAVVLVILVVAGLAWAGWRAWGLAFWDAHQAARYRPQADQIANQQAADAYAAHHPQVRSVRFVRRGRHEE